MMTKKQQREKLLNKRARLSKKEVDEKSRLIKEKLFKLKDFSSAKKVMFYLDFRNEVATEKMIISALKMNKKIVVPISDRENKSLFLSELKDYQQELSPGTYGILEPKEEYYREVNKKELDLIILPGVAFDKSGNRIGYGAGYYDRFLSQISQTTAKVALAYEFQLVDKIKVNQYDIPVDKIVTEKRVINSNTDKVC